MKIWRSWERETLIFWYIFKMSRLIPGVATKFLTLALIQCCFMRDVFIFARSALKHKSYDVFSPSYFLTVFKNAFFRYLGDILQYVIYCKSTVLSKLASWVKNVNFHKLYLPFSLEYHIFSSLKNISCFLLV